MAEITHEQNAQDTISPMQSNDTADMDTIALDTTNQPVEPPTHMTPQRRPTPSPAPDISDTREFPRLLPSGETSSLDPDANEFRLTSAQRKRFNKKVRKQKGKAEKAALKKAKASSVAAGICGMLSHGPRYWHQPTRTVWTEPL